MAQSGRCGVEGDQDCDKGNVLSVPGRQYAALAPMLRVTPRSLVRRMSAMASIEPDKSWGDGGPPFANPVMLGLLGEIRHRKPQHDGGLQPNGSGQLAGGGGGSEAVLGVADDGTQSRGNVVGLSTDQPRSSAWRRCSLLCP